MSDSNENIVIFPIWQARLQKESLIALNNQDFEEALSKIEKLLSYDILNHEIAVGKLLSLMELGRYREAEEFNEMLLSMDMTKENNYYYYYSYLHIYLTILLHMNEYEQLIQIVEREFNNPALYHRNVPEVAREQLYDVYHMAKKFMKEYSDEKSIELLEELTEAIGKEDYSKQWYIIENLRKTESKPTQTIISFLKQEVIHPVVKTTIFLWLKDLNVSDDVDIQKLGLRLTVKPKDVTDIREDITYRQVLLCIRDIEQENPTLYQLLEKLLYRYVYVRYPVMPPSQDVLVIANALKGIGQQYLYEHEQEWDKDVQKYMDELRMCETLYLSVIEE